MQSEQQQDASGTASALGAVTEQRLEFERLKASIPELIQANLDRPDVLSRLLVLNDQLDQALQVAPRPPAPAPGHSAVPTAVAPSQPQPQPQPHAQVAAYYPGAPALSVSQPATTMSAAPPTAYHCSSQQPSQHHYSSQPYYYPGVPLPPSYQVQTRTPPAHAAVQTPTQPYVSPAPYYYPTAYTPPVHAGTPPAYTHSQPVRASVQPALYPASTGLYPSLDDGDLASTTLPSATEPASQTHPTHAAAPHTQCMYPRPIGSDAPVGGTSSQRPTFSWKWSDHDGTTSPATVAHASPQSCTATPPEVASASSVARFAGAVSTNTTPASTSSVSLGLSAELDDFVLLPYPSPTTSPATPSAATSAAPHPASTTSLPAASSPVPTAATPSAATSAAPRPASTTSLPAANSPVPTATVEEFTCPICYCELEEGEVALRLENCAHRYCEDCVRQYVRTAMEQGAVLRLTCPHPECETPLDYYQVRQLLDAESGCRYEQLALVEQLKNSPAVHYCPRPACGNVMVVVATGEDGAPQAAGCRMVCDRRGCGTVFCVECGLVWHQDQSCAEAAAALAQDPQMTRWYKKHDTRRCPACTAVLLKNGGCNHMTCGKCGHNFCWLCMGDYEEGHYDRGGPCQGQQFPLIQRVKMYGIIGGLALAAIPVAALAIPIVIVGVPIYAAHRALTGSGGTGGESSSEPKQLEGKPNEKRNTGGGRSSNSNSNSSSGSRFDTER
jgi:IBR domain/IBR domain, a half RING-finger domain